MGNLMSFENGMLGIKSPEVFPRSFEELSCWCEEANDLVRNLDNWDETKFKSTTSSSSSSFPRIRRFVPFLHKSLLSSSKNARSKLYRAQTLLDDHRGNFDEYVQVKHISPFQFASPMRGMNKKILVLVLSDDDCVNGNFPKDTKHEFKLLTVWEFSFTISLLRRLRLLTETGFDQRESEDETTSTPERVTDEGENGGKEECLICMDADVDVLLPCAHGFCSTCAKQWIEANNSCPICRKVITNTTFQHDQWQLETWSKDDATKSIDCVIANISTYWDSIAQNLNARSELDIRNFFVLWQDIDFKFESDENGGWLLVRVAKIESTPAAACI